MNDTQETDQIEIAEREIDNILGRAPGRLLKFGTIVIFMVMLIIFIGSSFFSYPDSITAKVMVTTEVPPFQLVSASGGKIGNLFVSDNKKIEAGTIVAVMENAVDTKDMLSLSDLLQRTDSVVFPESEPRLGEFQAVFTAWKYDIIAYTNFHRLQYHAKSIQGLRQQLNYLKEYIAHGERQDCYLKEQLRLEEEKFRSDQFLAAHRVIAGSDLDKSKMELLQKQSGTEANQAAMADSRIRMVQLQQSILDLELDHEKQCRTFEAQIRHSREILIGQIKQWEQNYVLRAPLNGQLIYSRYWTAGEYVAAGETMFTLLRQDKGTFQARIELPMAKSGKVKPGQEVHIKLDNYPYMEYGILKGFVNHVSPVASKEIYRVDVSLPDGLVGSYGKKLPFLQGMSGTADIITEKQTIMQRLLFPIRSLMKNQSRQE